MFVNTDRELVMLKALSKNNYLMPGNRVVEFHGPAAWQIYHTSVGEMARTKMFTELWVELNNPQPDDLLIVRQENGVRAIFEITERINPSTIGVKMIADFGGGKR